MFRTLLIIGFGGFLGSTMRYLTQVGITKLFGTSFPLGTMAANVIGCFIIGLVYSWSEELKIMSPEWRIFLTVGFCGSYTTFSTFAFDNLLLINQSQWASLLFNILLSITLGLIAVYFGISAHRLLAQ